MTNVFEVAALSSLMQLYPALPAKESVPTLLQQDLYFGRNIGATGRVTEQQFRKFLKDVVAPRFSTGITVYDAKGQFLDNDGDLIRERSKVISLVYEDKASNQQAINDIITTYKQQFQQESVLQVENEDIAVGLGQGEDLIANDPTPELIQVDLYFGRNIGTTGRVSDRQFRQFLHDEITPRFPNGLTVYDADGQFLDIAFPNLVRYNKGLKPLVRPAKMYLIRSGIAIVQINCFENPATLFLSFLKTRK